MHINEKRCLKWHIQKENYLQEQFSVKQAGEGDNGMKAVATVIMNRVNVSEGEYSRISQGGNIRNIIYQQ